MGGWYDRDIIEKTYTFNFIYQTRVVIFDNNDGSNKPGNMTVRGGNSLGTLPQAPERPGYTFAGWNTRADGSGTEITENSQVFSTMTVYAQWTKNTASGGGTPGGGETPGGSDTSRHSQRSREQHVRA